MALGSDLYFLIWNKKWIINLKSFSGWCSLLCLLSASWESGGLCRSGGFWRTRWESDFILWKKGSFILFLSADNGRPLFEEFFSESLLRLQTPVLSERLPLWKALSQIRTVQQRKHLLVNPSGSRPSKKFFVLAGEKALSENGRLSDIGTASVFSIYSFA